MTVSVSVELSDRLSHLAAVATGKATVEGILQIARFGTRMSRQTAECSRSPYDDGLHLALTKLTTSELTQAALIAGRISEKQERASAPVTLDTPWARRRREVLRMVSQVWRAVR